MDTRIIRDKSKGEGDTPQMVDAVIWATLIQEESKEMWKLPDAEVSKMVNDQIADLLDYEATHDEWGNPVDGILVRLGKGGYSVATIFDNSLDTQE